MLKRTFMILAIIIAFAGMYYYVDNAATRLPEMPKQEVRPIYPDRPEAQSRVSDGADLLTLEDESVLNAYILSEELDVWVATSYDTSTHEIDEYVEKLAMRWDAGGVHTGTGALILITMDGKGVVHSTTTDFVPVGMMDQLADGKWFDAIIQGINSLKRK